METRYMNRDERLGDVVEFTMTDAINQYRLCGWDEIETDEGTLIMSDDEIIADVLTHDIEEI